MRWWLSTFHKRVPGSGRGCVAFIRIKLLVLLFGLFLLASQRVFSQISRDTIFFTNGTIVIGKIKNVKLGVITFDPDDAGDITVQLRKLKSIAASSTVFRIETTDHEVYFGKLVPHSVAGYVSLAEDSATVFYIENISVLYRSHNAFLHRFSGSIGLGYSYTKSSNFGRLNYDGKLYYRAEKEELSLSASGIYDITDSGFSRNREDAHFKYNYYFTPTWFATGLLGYQRNIELSLLRRYQEGAGIGNKFITSRHFYAWARSGAVLNQEKSTDEVSSATLAEVFMQIELNFFRFSKPKINLVTAQTIYYSLSQKDRFRNDGETGISWEIWKNFNLTLTVNNNYDSKPPVEGSHNFDFSIVFGINYTFY
jgi:hypothetical protein